MKETREQRVKGKMIRRRAAIAKKTATENKLRKLELAAKPKQPPFVKFKSDMTAIESNSKTFKLLSGEIQEQEARRKLVREKMKLGHSEQEDEYPEGLDAEECKKIQTSIQNLFEKTQNFDRTKEPVAKEEIDWDKFNDYFFLADGKYKPVKGQVLVRYLTMATLEKGPEKETVIRLLSTNPNGFIPAKNFLMKTIFAEEKSCIQLLGAIMEDLTFMSGNDILNKSYKFVLQQFYWTQRKYVPDDVHWQVIDILNSQTAQDFKF